MNLELEHRDGLARDRALTTWQMQNPRYQSGVMAAAGFKAGWEKAVKHIRDVQMAVESMPVAELAWELSRGEASPLWPLFHADPQFWAICDNCEQRELFDASGVCPACHYEHI